MNIQDKFDYLKQYPKFNTYSIENDGVNISATEIKLENKDSSKLISIAESTLKKIIEEKKILGVRVFPYIGYSDQDKIYKFRCRLYLA